MSIQGVSPYGYASPFQAGQAQKGKNDASSADFGGQMRNTANVSGKVYKVYMKTDDMLYSGGNGSGLSFYIKYAESSTEEDPTVVAKGVDENGNEFEQTIHINKINPRCATMVEMHALEAYLGVDKDGGLSSLPMDPSAGNMGLHDRADFITMFQKQIRDMNTLGQSKLAAYYRYSMKMYCDFMAEKSGSAGLTGTGSVNYGELLAGLDNPLARRMKGQSGEKEKEASGADESKSDSEIITQADGSKTLLITNQIGGTKMVTSIQLSKPSPMANDQKAVNGTDMEESARTPITGEIDGKGAQSGN